MITSIVKEQPPKKQPSKYPCVKIQKEGGLVVLFLDKTKGTCLQSGSIFNFPIGHFSTGWVNADEETWSDFHGEITIKVD